MAAQTRGSICAPVLHGSSIGGPVTLIYILHGGEWPQAREVPVPAQLRLVLLRLLNSLTVAAVPSTPPGITPSSSPHSEGFEFQVNSISISSTKEQTTISLCDGEVTVLIKPKPKGRVALEEQTLCVLRDFYQGRRSRNQHPASVTLSRAMEEILHHHSAAYSGMVQRLCLEQQDDSMKFVRCVAEILFDDGVVNWGRIASLVAFGAVVCERLKEAGREQCVENVIQHISTYLSTDQRQWLINNKAWGGFVEFFREDDPESRVWNTLKGLVIAGGGGVGLGLVLLTR
ncbi:hypothetical protein AOLI_G00189630 [Acnodon oligacanthus]